MLSDLLRLTDKDIEQTFKLCYAILVDEETATNATCMSIAAIGLEADEERSKLRRIIKKRFSRKIHPEEIEINYQYLLQRIVLEKTRRFENAQEKEIRTRARIHEDTWLLRYLKHIISFSSTTEHAVTSAYCRVIHDYSRETAQRVHTFLVQSNPNEKKSLEEFSKWKRRIDNKLNERFKDLLVEKKEKGNIRRFIQTAHANEKKEYVVTCLKLLRPWGIICPLPVMFSEFSKVQRLQRNSNDPIREQSVKDSRIATLIDYDCFSRLMSVFDGGDPREHLLIPHFVLPVDEVNNRTPPADLDNLPDLTSEGINKIRRQLGEQSLRRERLMPRWLQVIIDGEVIQDVYDLHTSRSINVVLGNPPNFIEVLALDAGTQVPFASKTLAWLKPSSPKTLSYSTKLEAGQKISFKITYSEGLDGEVATAPIKIHYRETNWARALAFHVKRMQERLPPRMVLKRFSNALHALLLDAARPLNMTLHVLAVLSVMVIVVLIGRNVPKPWRANDIARSHPPLSLSSPSPENIQDSRELGIALKDGAAVVSLDSDGRVQGLPDGLSAGDRQIIEEALRTQRLSVAPLPKELKSESEGRMGSPTESAPFNLVWPVGKVVISRRPRFRWTNLRGAINYRVEVFDTRYHLVSESQGYVRTTTWRIPRGAALRPGGIYIWKVIATSNGSDEPSGLPSLPSVTETFAEAKFKVLESSKAREIERVKKVFPNSHLLLGLAYARAGLIDEAEREFRSLASANPESELAQSFLNQLKRSSR